MSYKTRFIGLIIVTIMCFSSGVYAYEKPQPFKTFYVWSHAAKTGDGSYESPFQNLEEAKSAVRKINNEMKGDIEVVLLDGEYYLDETFVLTEEDSGKNGYNVIYRGEKEKYPVISGGRKITGFTKCENGLYSAKVLDDDIKGIRQLSINGRAARLASSERSYEGLEIYNDPATLYENDGMYIDSAIIGEWKNPKDIVFNWPLTWMYYKVRVESLKTDPKNPERTIVTFQQPYWQYLSSYGTTDFAAGVYMSNPKHLFTIENAFELLDTPGEFYFDKLTGMLYYMPLEGENIEEAVAVAPVLEKVIEIKGEGVGHHVENIRFTGLTVSDATWYMLHDYSYLEEQARVLANSESTGHPAGIMIDHATNIKIDDCIIKNMSYYGIKAGDGVYDSEIRGNAIFDMGGGAVAVSERWHAFFREPEYPDGPAEVFGRKPFYVSSMETAQTRPTYMRDSLFENISDGFGAWWKSHPSDGYQGIYSWMLADLEKEYDIDHIRLRFSKDAAGGNAIRNFEVLASNDRDFETYSTFYVQGNKDADEVLKVEGDGKKYRYIMVRKTKLEQLQIAEMDVFSFDEKPIRKDDVCKNIVLADNYIERIGHECGSAVAVDFMLPEHATIENNEIRYTAYSGMQVGWGWSLIPKSVTCRENTVRGNIFEMPNMIAVDGGALYTNSQMPNSLIEKNYFISQLFYCGPIYHDPGSIGLTVRDNVMEVVPSFPTLPNFTYKNIDYYNNYSAQPNKWVSQTDVENLVIEEPKLYVPGTEPIEAKNIIENAGVSQEYKYMKEKVIKNEIQMGQGRNIYTNLASANGSARGVRTFQDKMGENFLNNASFGSLPGQYSPIAAIKLKKALERYNTYLTSNVKDEDVTVPMQAQNQLLEFKNYLNYLTLSELIKYCDEILENAKVGKSTGEYTELNITKFSEILKTVKSANEKEEYAAKLKLEKALREFYVSGNHTEVIGVMVNGTEGKIDKENKTITVKLPALTEIKKVIVDLMVSEDAQLQTDFSKAVDLRWTKQIVLYNKKTGKRVVWSLNCELEKEKIVNEFFENTLNSWYNLDGNKPYITNSKFVIPTSYVPYMLKSKQFENQIDLNFAVNESSKNNGFSLIFEAKTPTILHDGIDSINNHFRLLVKGNKITLYSMENGSLTTISEADKIDLKANLINSINVEHIGRNLKVVFNGETVLNTITKNIATKGYAGLYVPNSQVELYNGR